MISFVAPSGTGKTSLVEKVIAVLIEQGLDVAAVKHDAHRIELDTEGKDSWRMRAAGATGTILAGQNQLAWMGSADRRPELGSLVDLFFAEADVVIVEGYRSAGLPTILVQRPEVEDPTWHAPSADLVLLTAHPDDVTETVDVILAHVASVS